MLAEAARLRFPPTTALESVDCSSNSLMRKLNCCAPACKISALMHDYKIILRKLFSTRNIVSPRIGKLVAADFSQSLVSSVQITNLFARLSALCIGNTFKSKSGQIQCRQPAYKSHLENPLSEKIQISEC